MTPEFPVRPNPASHFEQFGTSVALSNGVAIVGAINDLPGPGTAYIFTVDGAGATQRTRLTPSTSRVFDYFGRSVGIDGNYAVVGAPGGLPRGQAFIFAWDGAAWNEQAVLSPSDGAPLGQFGVAVSIDGDAAVIGANGAAYVFRRTGHAWNEEAKLTEPSSTAASFFGRSVSISGDRAIVGNSAGSMSQSAGVAYVFHRNGAAWTVEATLAPSDPVAIDEFGAAVAIDGDHAVVGAPGATSSGRVDVGAAYVFERTGSNWLQRQKLEPSNTHSVNDFGEAVALRGDYLVVGDPAQHLPVAGTGAAYVYRRHGNTWALVPPRIVPADAGTDFYDMFAWFGKSVAVSRAGVLVGAPGNTDTLREQGAAYFYPFPLDVGSLITVPTEFALFVRVLFGLIGGGGGIVVPPGSGPTPIDPEPFREWHSLPESKRQLIMGMALTELTSFIDDADARKLVTEAGRSLTAKAAAKITKVRKVDVSVEKQVDRKRGEGK